ncbi:MAG: hypothetical protein KQI62_07620 [Deltaproteobacteria bacterium]|nr:hypothetical protein [Deltaproteobacteria bacterium]
MQRKAGLVLAVVGFLFLCLTVPIFGFVVDRAWSQGNMLASVSFVILVGIAGLVLMLVGWSMMRRR